MRSSNGATENYDRYSNLSASHVGTTFFDYISKSNSSPYVCKAINMIEGCLPAPNQAPRIHVEQPKNIVLSSHRTDVDNSVFLLLILGVLYLIVHLRKLCLRIF